LTKLLSFLIFSKEKAKAIVTAKGRPSGTAITIIVIPIIMNPTNLSKIFVTLSTFPRAISTTRYTVKTVTVNTAQAIPIFPISFATPSNLSYKGVGGCSYNKSAFNFPTSNK